MLKRGLASLLICLCWCLYSEAANFKMKPYEPSNLEMARLPEMCIPKWLSTRNSPRAKSIDAYYKRVFGKDWIHMHHY